MQEAPGRKIPIARPLIDDYDVEAVVRVLRSGMLAHGPEVERFEEEFADYVGVEYAVAVANGTMALDLVLRAYRIGPGDEVVTTPFSFVATANAVLYQGARPVFADIDPETYNIDPDTVLDKITSRTRAIVAVHLYGHPADMRALREIAEDHDLILVEDAAQAHGAECHGAKAGAMGDAAAFSFYATKNMTTGEGGMVTTNDRRVAERVRVLRDQGQRGKYRHVTLGFNYRMTSIAAALGRAQLRKLDSLNEARRRNAERLTRGLRGLPGIATPVEREGCRHVYHQYVVRVTGEAGVSRDELASRLASQGVGVAVHYPTIIPDQPLYRKLGIGCPDCREARRAAGEVLSLPVHPALEPGDLDYIVAAVSRALGARA